MNIPDKQYQESIKIYTGPYLTITKVRDKHGNATAQFTQGKDLTKALTKAIAWQALQR